MKCLSVKSEIFNWSFGHNPKQEEKREVEVLRSSPGRSRSDIGQNLSSSPGSPPGHSIRDTPISRTRRRRSSQFHCLNAGCRTHFLTRGLRDSHMRRNCQFRVTQVKLFYLNVDASFNALEVVLLTSFCIIYLLSKIPFYLDFTQINVLFSGTSNATKSCRARNQSFELSRLRSVIY